MKPLHVIGAALMLALLTGCMHSGYDGESYPETSAVEVFQRNDKLPEGYSVMGRAWVSGELSGTTRPELENKLKKMAMSRGADAMVIKASVIRQDGLKITGSAEEITDATDSPTQAQLKVTVDRDLKDLSEENHEKRYERVIVADFLRKELPAQTK